MRGDGSCPDGDSENGEKGLNSVYILKVDPRGYTEELMEGLERNEERRVKVDNDDLGLNTGVTSN